MKRLLVIVLLLLASPAMASHIVGGEFEMIYDPQTGRYKIQLILYFDKINGNPGAKDAFITVRIFRKRDNAVMRNVNMRLTDESKVKYFQPHCSSGSTIDTDKLVYSIDNFDQMMALPAAEFSDSQGYYLAWERCCRNYTITNVISQDPSQGSQFAGQTFYLEFPPVTKNGEPFINSSPRLFPPLSDYACPRKKYFVDFSGVDDDGDSLAYSLIRPLNTKTGDALPPGGFPRPGPYPTVQYRSPFSDNNIMQGLPDLKITAEGLLTVTPTVAGLFVFAVKCEEYRDGVKIGEVRRDFQMLVLQSCPTSENPVVKARPKDSNEAFAENKLSVSFSNMVSDDDRCVDIQLNDDDSKSQDNNFEETLTVKIIPLGFKGDISKITLSRTEVKILNGQPETFSVCFPECPYLNGPYNIGVVVFDKACPLPNSDTIVVTVNITPPVNNPPAFSEHLIVQTVKEGEAVPTWQITGTDADLDNLTLWADNASIAILQKYGFAFSTIENQPGSVKANLTWNTRCDEVDFSDKINTDGKVRFDLKFLLEDVDKCLSKTPDVMNFKLTMDLIDVHPPVIEYVPDRTKKEVTLYKKIFESVSFKVEGRDVDNDWIVLKGAGEGFNLSTYDMTFPSSSAEGFVESVFNWYISCGKNNLKLRDNFPLYFMVVDDQNRCGYYLADTLNVTVIVAPPENTAPNLFISGQQQELTLAYTLGDEINFPLLGTDIDKNPNDQLKIQLVEATGNVLPSGYVLQTEPGQSPVHGTFVWKPDCEIFENRIYENHYTFTFRVIDDRCFNEKADSLKVNLTIKDVENDLTEFIPPNFISPNGDGWNDFFAMVKRDESTGELVSILPKDNCTGHFEGITIFNRWGREVYESSNRDFRWYANDEPTGMYYYLLKYSDKVFKGIITIADDDSQRHR